MRDDAAGMDNTPKLRLSGPGSVVAAVPLLLGFPPQESLVLVGLRGDRSRLGLTMRVDLPPDGPGNAPRVEELRPMVEALHRDGATQSLVIVLTERPDDEVTGQPCPPYIDLVDNLDAALLKSGVDLTDAVLVRAGRWRSYLCLDAGCCSPEGEPVPEAPADLAAHTAYAGSVLRDSRAALEALIAPDPPRVAATERALDHVCRELAEATTAGTSEAYRARIEEFIDRRVRALAGGAAGSLTHRDAARVSVTLVDRQIRDRVAGHCLEASAAAAESLWIDLLGRLPPPLDAAPATLLALSAWARGDGAMANVALDRALDSDPGYSLAQLVRTGLDHALPPSTVREMLDYPSAAAG